MSSAAESLLNQLPTAAGPERRALPPLLIGLVGLGDSAIVAGAGVAARLLAAEGPAASPFALALAALLTVNLFAAAGAYRLEHLRYPAEQAARLTPAWTFPLGVEG